MNTDKRKVRADCGYCITLKKPVGLCRRAGILEERDRLSIDGGKPMRTVSKQGS
jgi:hypothetical protein